MISNSRIINFIPSTNFDVSRLFYEDKLGLILEKEDDFALEYKINTSVLRIIKVADFTPAIFTILGWDVSDINSIVKELMIVGIKFELYDGIKQNKMRICSFPGGSQVAWFKDPDGNTLSITQVER